MRPGGWLRLGAAAGVAASAMCLAPEAHAQDVGNPDRFYRATAYLWWANIDGINYIDDLEITVGDSTQLHASFAGELQIGKGRLAGIAKFSTTSLDNTGAIEGEDVPDGSTVEYDFRWTTAELLASWQAGRFETTQALKLVGGLRYAYQKQELLDGPQPGSTSKSWVEPLVGAEYFILMGGPFEAAVDGEVGGFGLGARFTWRVGAELAVRVAGPVLASLRYDYLQTEVGSTDSDYRWDEGVSQGWFFGLTITR